MRRLLTQCASKYSPYIAPQQSRPFTIPTSIIIQKLGHTSRLSKPKDTPRDLTKAEYMKATKWLEKGIDIPDIATRLGKSESIVKWTLMTDKPSCPISKGTKKGKFMIEEIEYLLEMFQHGIQPPEIAKRLGRPSTGIHRQLAQLAEQIRIVDRPLIHQGPQALPPDIQESIFSARLKELWDGLLELEMTDTWREVLSRERRESWLADIASSIPAEVKKLLSSLEPPTAEELEKLPWVDTTKAGVYAWLLKPRAKLYLNSHCFLYVGSGTGVKHGLSGRRESHLSEKWHNPRLLRLIKQRRLQREGKFITLMMMEMKVIEGGDVVRTRYVVTLAEAILTMWLASLGERRIYERGFGELCPWGPRGVAWSGCTSHNPLTKDIVVGAFEAPKRSRNDFINAHQELSDPLLIED